MKRVLFYSRWHLVPAHEQLVEPTKSILVTTPPLRSRSNRPLAMTTEDLINILTYYHLQEFSSGRELIQALQEDEYARRLIAPAGGIKHSTFFDTVNERGVEQLFHMFTELHKKAASLLPAQHLDLGDLVAVDGSLINSVLSMHWADYQTHTNKAKLHLGFNLNHGLPCKLVLTEGKSAERPRVEQLVDPGQTAVMDRGYQAHQRFDQWQEQSCHFVCRIKEATRKEVLQPYPLVAGSPVFFDAQVLLGTPGVNQTKTPVRLVGYQVDGVTYWIATDRFDLTAEQVALAYKLRWNIETFFGWWKRHLHVYHLFVRSENGLMVQILSGLITYLLLAMYCQKEHGEPVSIVRVRQLRNQIRNEALLLMAESPARPRQRGGKMLRKRIGKSHASSCRKLLGIKWICRMGHQMSNIGADAQK